MPAAATTSAALLLSAVISSRTCSSAPPLRESVAALLFAPLDAWHVRGRSSRLNGKGQPYFHSPLDRYSGMLAADNVATMLNCSV